MKLSPVGILIILFGVLAGIILWVVGYFSLPNQDTHRNLAANNPVQSSVKQNSTGTSAPATGSSSQAGSSKGGAVAAVGNAQNGQQLFQQNCAACHSTGTNTIVGPGLKGIFSKTALPNGKQVTVANVEDWIKTGGGGMPPFSSLSTSDRADLAAYLQTLK